MLIKNSKIYAIPGWGFFSEIFRALSIEHSILIGLDYFDIPPTTLEAIAEHLSQKIPDHSVLLGWSFGGLIAIKMASLFPHKVKKLLLISSQPKFLSDIHWLGIDSHQADNFMRGFRDHAETQINQFITLVSYPHRRSDNIRGLMKHFLYHREESLLRLLNILFNTDLRKEYQNLTLDILHIVNKQDAIIKQNEHQLKALNPKITVISLEKTGHAGFLHCYDIYQNIIKSFLQ